jgi:hypothetical protein
MAPDRIAAKGLRRLSTRGESYRRFVPDARKQTNQTALFHLLKK